MTAPIADPATAVEQLLGRLQPVGTQAIAWHEATGRVLAQPLVSDRDSPAHDVSSMDGYAVRLADLLQERMQVAGEVEIGRPPPEMVPGKALKIVTGACGTKRRS